MLDSPDTTHARKELDQYIQDGFLMPEMPLLVFACFEPANDLYITHLARQLGLEEEIGRNWYVRFLDDNLEGVWASLGWLVDQM